MTTELNRKSKTLFFIEEEKVVCLDLYRQLLKIGFDAIYENNMEKINEALTKTNTGVVITDLKVLARQKHFNGNKVNVDYKTLTDSCENTLVFDDAMKVVKQFSKPYDINKVVDFLNSHYSITTQDNSNNNN